ncbi:hypothetical protein NX773_02815 [Massilia solisilvae]|uniref:Lipoprotein n=1 Tax=Massilia solisilvae TaxID=1811225 RepID=A0ABT2BF97_9BURK|nr:hypothetical protein [Massilia solisilvae]MCS0607096.1 hypothetical protein [Massilia solisilvae]
MKRLLVLACVVLGGCSAFHGKADADAPVATAKPAAPQLVAEGVPIERIPFRAGVSSVTVEKMARHEQCTGGEGAGLVTEPGPVEVYRMQCENGKVFMARCELRQCSRM